MSVCFQVVVAASTVCLQSHVCCLFSGRGRGKRSLSPVLMNEARYQQLMTRHKKRKVTTPNAPELRTAGITLSDVMVRTYMPRSAVTESSGG